MRARVDLVRRDFLSGCAAVAAAAATGTAPLAAAERGRGQNGALRAFSDAFGGIFNAERRLAFLAPNAMVIAHDVPFPLSREAFADHLAFQAGLWDQLEWALTAPRAVAHGKLTIVSSLFNERGKPKDSGFRLRPGFATATCVSHGGTWRAIGLHYGALLGQMLDASPS